ncbi:ABC transporter transmembrane domain-containing protein, partial [Cytobacillus firmus]
MTTGKRLFQYALHYKKTIIAALLMLTVAVAADLAGPFIAKKMIDDHILGIESVWYQTEGGKDAVEYDGQFYKKEQNIEQGERKIDQARILQAGSQFVFIRGDIAFDGERAFKEGKLYIEKSGQTETYAGKALTGEELMLFYSPEIPKIVQLLAFYFGLLVIAAFFQYGQRFFLQKSANRIIQQMREDVFGQIQRLPISYFDNLPAGKVVAR